MEVTAEMEATTETNSTFFNSTEPTHTYWNNSLNPSNNSFNEIYNHFNETSYNFNESSYNFNESYYPLNKSYYSINESYNSVGPTIQDPGPTYSEYLPLILSEMALSCICLILSLAIYFTNSEFHNVHGKNLISMSSCLLVTFIMLITDKLVRNFIPYSVCIGIAMVIHTTFLATFAWTNVMAFDIWKLITDMKVRGEVKGRSTKYLKYSIYAWTLTVVTTTPAVVLHLTDLVAWEYRPQFGVKRCWLSGVNGFIFFFDVPVGAILCCNLVMFFLTLRKLITLKRMTAVLNVKQQQKRLNLYLKLLLVMGLTFTAELIPWATGMYSMAGIVTALQGVFLFITFVGKKRILKRFYNSVVHKKEMTMASQSTSQMTLSSSKFSMENLGDSRF